MKLTTKFQRKSYKLAEKVFLTLLSSIPSEEIQSKNIHSEKMQYIDNIAYYAISTAEQFIRVKNSCMVDEYTENDTRVLTKLKKLYKKEGLDINED